MKHSATCPGSCRSFKPTTIYSKDRYPSRIRSIVDGYCGYCGCVYDINKSVIGWQDNAVNPNSKPVRGWIAKHHQYDWEYKIVRAEIAGIQFSCTGSVYETLDDSLNAIESERQSKVVLHSAHRKDTGEGSIEKQLRSFSVPKPTYNSSGSFSYYGGINIEAV